MNRQHFRFIVSMEREKRREAQREKNRDGNEAQNARPERRED